MKKITLALVMAGSILLSSCDVINQLASQFSSVANLANCEFALKNEQVPLALDVNVDITNPTKTQAAMTALDWILAIDGTDIANGVNSRSYTIKPSTTTMVPLPVSTDLGQLFSKKGLDALKNFASSFTSDGTSSKVGLRVKPSLSVGTTQVPFPNYITLEKKTGGNTKKKS